MAFHTLFNTQLLFAILLCLDFGLSEDLCFFPNGKTAVGDIPCNPTAADSVCCGKGWTCLSSKVCEFNQDSPDSDVDNSIGEQWRGSCTDKDWQSGLCPKFCYGECYGCCPDPEIDEPARKCMTTSEHIPLLVCIRKSGKGIN